MDLTGLGSAFGFASGVLDRFFPPKMTEAEKTVALTGLTKAIEDRDAARDTLKRDVMVAELQQQDTYTKRGRPTIIYAGLTFIFIVHVLFPCLAFFTGRPVPDLVLPSEFWLAWGGICSVYSIGRSSEKNGNTSRVIKTITGN